MSAEIILADTPGHERYTRNMFSGAFTADVAVVLVDAQAGLVTHTRRHGHMSALRGVCHAVFCVNKMDLVDWSQARWAEVEEEVRGLAARLEIPDAVRRCALKHTSRPVRATVQALHERTGPETLHRQDNPPSTWHSSALGRSERWSALALRGATVLLTGLRASGKSTIAVTLERRLVGAGRAAYLLDGDNIRQGLSDDLGFYPGDRAEHIRHVGQVARLFADAGVVAVVSLICPLRSDRELLRRSHDEAGLQFEEVFIDTPVAECERRDPMGLYARARAGEIRGFTGIDAPYKVPERPEVHIRTSQTTVDAAVSRILELLGAGGG